MNDEGNDRDRLINAAIEASIEFEELMDKTDFDSWLDGVCLCSWNKIPGEDSKILRKFLKDKILIENFEIKWVETEKIKELEEGKVIEVVTRENSLSLRLNDDETKVELEIDNGRVYEFTVETKGDKLNICFTDSSKTLNYLGQSDGPFKNYEKNKKELKYICDRMKREVINNSSNSVVNSSLERYLISKLFDAKIKRLEARICSKKEDEKEKYKEALLYLLSALNEHDKFFLQMKQNGSNKSLNPGEDNAFDMWLILLYNDLSICYAGLDNSSMSRGYAEEAREIIEKKERYLFGWKKIPEDDNKGLITFLKENYGIKWVKTAKIKKIDDDKTINVFTNKNSLSLKLNDEKTKVKLLINNRGDNEFTVKIKNGELNIYEKSYKEFEKKLSANNSTNKKNIKKHYFVTSRLFELYTIALFNQAEAERRTNQYTEAEKNFKKIKNYGEKNTCLINFNHYSAILYLSLLYIDQGRGKEAIELLDKIINKLNEADIRYWKAFIAKSQALIDQSEYDEAKGLLFNKFLEEQEYSYVLNKEHKVTSQGFKGLNYFTSCQIENVRNTLNIKDSDKVVQLNKVKNLMEDNIINFKKRKQKGFETKAYKHLSEIYILLKEHTTAMEYFIKYLSNGNIDKLKNFISDPKMEDWIDKCNDLGALESFSKELVIDLKDEPVDEKEKYQALINILIEKIKQECEDKDQLSLSERLVANLNEVVGKRKVIKYKEDPFFKESSRGEREDLSKEEIRIRLDINEKGFDSVLFKRSEMKEPKLRVAEVIVLRRWNSFSPGLYRESIGSLGGGYLLRINKTLLKKGDEEDDSVDNKIAENKVLISEESSDKKKDEVIENIVIDPGYNFLQNFRSEGFCIEDIDTIIVTHSHLDHCAELLPLMDLIFQFNKRYESTLNSKRQKKRVNLCLSQGTYKKFSSYTNDPDWQKQLKDVIILEDLPEKKWRPFNGLTISAIQTPHMDLGGVNAIGLMIKIDVIVGENEDNLKTVRLGFTGDTPWYSGIRENFGGCDFLCVHLGSIKYQEIGYTDDRYYLNGEEKREIGKEEKEEKFKETYTKSNHLLFFGTKDIISHYDKKKEDSLIIVGEFGEELKYGLRVDLCNKLSMGKTLYLFNFSDITKGKGRQELLNRLRTLYYYRLAKNMKGAKYSEEKGGVRITKDKKKIATLKIKKDFCYLERDKHDDIKIGLVKKEDNKRNIYKKSIDCLPGDIGQYIVIEKDGTKKVRCNFCESFVRPNEITTFSYGREDAIQYICQTCNNTLSELQKQAIIEHRVTRH